MQKFFGEIKMTWPKLIAFAVISGLYTGAVCLFPALENTSFHDIAVYPEWWFLFAIIVVTNCEKWWEASIKVFVFFLISQPLVYLVQVPFYYDGWGIFRYYSRWFIITLLTIPGGAIAYQIKRKDWLSALVMTVPCGYLGAACASYYLRSRMHFPNHILSSISCLAIALVLINCIMKEKKHKIFLYAVTGLIIAACLYLKFSF